MKRRFLLPLASCFWILTSPSAHALIDTNTNGLPDLWEKAFNSNALFSASNPAHAPSADPDGDGWTNLQESTAGTNPFSSAAPHGILTPAIGYTPAIREPAPPGAVIGQPGVVTPPLGTTDPFAGGAGSSATFTEPLEIRRPARFTLTWQPVVGKAYRIEQSTDLATWQPTTGFYMGGAVPITYQGEAILSDNTEPPKLFYRLKIEDADNDSDSLTDYEETLLGTDPYSADTDRDGIADNLDPQPLINALQATWDADATAPSGATLFAAFNFTPPASAGYPFTAERVTDISGSTRNGKARTQSGGLPVQQNPPQDNAEGIANQGFHCANTHHFAFEQKNPGINFAPVSSLSFWLKSKTSDLTGNGQPIFSYAPRTAVFAQSGNTSNPYAARAFIRKQATGSAYEVVWLNWTFPGNIVRERWTLDLTEFQINQRWINLTFVWQGTGSGQGAFWACYANGIKQNRTLGSSYRFQTTPTTANTPQDTFVIGADAAGGSSQNNLATIQSTFKGSMDRIRLHSTALSIAQVQAINAQDTDRDGLWDSTEASATTWKDTNANSKRDPGEIRYPNGSPIFWQPATNDADGDGLTDLVEQSIGTRIDHTDTDGDRLPDGWEVRFTLSPLDATGANGRDGDPDGDGLLNINEYRYASKPKPLPGDPAPGQPGSATDSDGDVTGDNAEFTGNSHPGNASDGGQPLAASEKISVFLAIGDESTSHSEDYSLEVSVIDPETGEEEHFHTLHAEGFGQYKSGTIDKFQKGHTYTFRILWNGTNRTDSQGPDFDYTCKIEPQGTGSGFLIDSYDVSSSTANLAAKLTGNNLNDVATDEEDFRAKYRHRRAVLMGVSTVSADRMFGASMQVLPGLEDIQLEIKNTTTNEDFGTHSQLFAKAYTDLREMYGAGDNFGKNIADPRVWFIQRFSGAYPTIQAYLTGDPALAHGSIQIQASLNGSNLGSISKTLTPDVDFADLIATTTAISRGDGFGYPRATGQILHGVGLPMPYQLSTPLRIAALTLSKYAENLSLTFVGLYRGMEAGFKDDIAFLNLLKDGNIIISASQTLVLAYTNRVLVELATDPVARTRQYMDISYNFCRDQICRPAASLHASLSSPQGIIDAIWNLGHAADQAATAGKLLVTHGVWNLCVEGIGDWLTDFSNRMLEAAEAHAWTQEAFPESALISGTEAALRTFSYATGYGMGYIAEQAAMGFLTAGGMHISKAFVYGGKNLSGKLTFRSISIIAGRGSILKKRLSGTLAPALADAMDNALIVSARTPLPEAGNKAIPDVIEDAMKATRSATPPVTPPVGPTWNELVSDLISRPNLIPVLENPAARHEIFKATAIAHQYISGDAIALRNWPKLLNAIAPNAASGITGDFLRYSDLFTALKVDTPAGKQVLIDMLQSIDTKTASELVLNGIPMPASIKNIYPQMYHYADEGILTFIQREAGDVLKLPAREDGNSTYWTPDLLSNIVDPRTVLQAPGSAKRYRIEIDIINDSSGFSIPPSYNLQNQTQNPWLEIMIKDNPSFGNPTGPAQFTTKSPKAIKVYDRTEERYLEANEF